MHVLTTKKQTSAMAIEDGAHTERRKRRRVNVDLRCYVVTQRIPNTKLAAWVQDLSHSGVRFGLDPETALWEPFKPGDLTPVEVVLPTAHHFGQRCIFGRGRVVRVTKNDNGSASIAVHFTRVDLRQMRSSRESATLELLSRLEM